MNRFAMAAGGLAVAAVAILVAANLLRGTPLWPGARYTEADRDRGTRRALYFIYAVASKPDAFRDWGHDLLSTFANVASTNGNREISDLAWRMGRERALEWRRQHREVPANAEADDIANLVYGSDAAEQLGIPDPHLREALRKAAVRFSPVDYLGFDPARQPPPANNRDAVFQDALISTYTGDHYGVPLGGHYADVLRWLPMMRPYPTHSAGRHAYYGAIYSITHVVYTYNGYNLNRISPNCFPQEFEYLKANLPAAIQDHDPETLGEYLDCLRAFGLTLSDPLIQRGVECLLSAQNSDGSWGDPHETDVYTRYHSTWSGIGGIQEFRWRGVLPCPVW